MKPTVTFGIPIAPKCRIDYWDKAMINLNRTLNSIENQTNSNYLIVAIKESEDELRLDKKYRNLVILNRKGELKEFSEDKDERTLMAMKYHYANNGQYFFRLDWDDLIHKELVEFIETLPNDGWSSHMNKGAYIDASIKLYNMFNTGISVDCGAIEMMLKNLFDAAVNEEREWRGEF